ncbi:hypothetical protein M0Q50_05810 [bacterium]|nr:hypothetical protein [bacterium]
MKPLTHKKKEIKKTHYKYSWYKNMVELLRNSGCKDFRNETTISCS